MTDVAKFRHPIPLISANYREIKLSRNGREGRNQKEKKKKTHPILIIKIRFLILRQLKGEPINSDE